MSRRPRITTPIAWAVIAAGVIAAFLPPVAGLPIFGYLAIALILVGGMLAMPADCASGCYARCARRAPSPVCSRSRTCARHPGDSPRHWPRSSQASR